MEGIKRCFNKPQIEFGNRKKLSLELNRFSKNTTLHGFSNIIKSKSNNWKAWIWRILFGFCLLCVTYGIYQIAYYFLMTPTTVNSSYRLYEDGPSIDHLFPENVRITVCKLPTWNISNEDDNFLSLYGFTALGFPLAILPLEDIFGLWDLSAFEIEDLLDIDYKYSKPVHRYDELMKLGYSPQKFIQNRSIGCEAIFTAAECEEQNFNFKPILTTYGQCFSAKVTASAQTTNFLSPEHRRSLEPEGYQVFVSHPFEHRRVLDSESRLFIPPDSYVKLNIKLTVTNREAIYTPWYGFTSNCPSLTEDVQPNETLRQLYNVRVCEELYIIQYAEKLRNCSTIISLKKIFDRICSPLDIITAFADFYSKMFQDYENVKDKMKEYCQDPCIEYTYDLDWKIAKLGGENFSQLEYVYNDNRFYLHEYRQISLSNVLGQVGGFLGLYLGASIITILEFMGFISRCFWYGVFPRRKQTAVGPSEPQRHNPLSYHRMLQRNTPNDVESNLKAWS